MDFSGAAFFLIYFFVYNIFIVANWINFPKKYYLLIILPIPWIFWLIGFRLQFKILEFMILYICLLLFFSLITRMIPRKKLSHYFKILLVGLALIYTIIYFGLGMWTFAWELDTYFTKPTSFALKSGYSLDLTFHPGIGSYWLGLELHKDYSNSPIYRQVDKKYLRDAEVEDLVIEENITDGNVKVSHNKNEIILRK